MTASRMVSHSSSECHYCLSDIVGHHFCSVDLCVVDSFACFNFDSCLFCLGIGNFVSVIDNFCGAFLGFSFPLVNLCLSDLFISLWAGFGHVAMLSTSEAPSFLHESLSFFISKRIEADIVNVHSIGIFLLILIVLRPFFG